MGTFAEDLLQEIKSLEETNSLLLDRLEETQNAVQRYLDGMGIAELTWILDDSYLDW